MEINMDDFEAIGRIKQGDIGGLELLIARYQLKAIRTAFLITHDERLAEDVVQDVFIRFFHHARHFDQARPFAPYFLRCVVNSALDATQKQSREVPLVAEGNEDGVLSILLSQARVVESQVEFTQLKLEILDSLVRLSPRQRAVIVQRYYLEMSEREIARELKVAPGTVKWLLNAARTRLRTILKMEGSVE
jgi:RNA polymerase sigma-70 factor (ECF subfamily)